jgi:hypothetical protein
MKNLRTLPYVERHQHEIGGPDLAERNLSRGRERRAERRLCRRLGSRSNLPQRYGHTDHFFSRLMAISATSVPGVMIDTDWWLPRVVKVMFEVSPMVWATT